MSIKLLILFLCIILGSSAIDYRSVLLQISSGTSYCNNEQMFGKFDLSEVPQFGAMCNVAMPNINQTEILIENNAVPILCMGLYDVSLRLCKSAKNDISPFADVFPPTTDKFSKLFNTLSHSEEFSSLEIFCSSTVNGYIINDAVSNVTQEWLKVLNHELSEKDSCITICRTNENNKVHPLCSYIIWSNGIYINHQKNQAEAQATEIGLVSDEGQVNTILENKIEDLKKVVNNVDQPMASATESERPQKNYVEYIPPVGSSLNPSLSDRVPLSQVEVGAAELNMTYGNSASAQGTEKQIVTVSRQEPASELGLTSQLAKQEDLVKPPQEKSSITSTLETEINPPAEPLKPTKKAEKQRKKQSRKKQPKVEAVPKPIQTNAEEAPKTDVESSAPVAVKPQPVDQVKPKTDQAGDDMVEGDFSLEVTPEGVGLDQPIVADKDPQQPYSDEEVEDGDGDDVDNMESDIPVKTPIKTPVNNISASKAIPEKPSLAPVDQGGVEPDKAYGEGEVEREILIEDHFIEAEDSHFFTYFLCMGVLTIMAYLAFHNKKKLIALAVEGRRTKGTRRRPNSSNYSKLDCSLEEALVSNTTASVTHVLY